MIEAKDIVIKVCQQDESALFSLDKMHKGDNDSLMSGKGLY